MYNVHVHVIDIIAYVFSSYMSQTRYCIITVQQFTNEPKFENRHSQSAFSTLLILPLPTTAPQNINFSDSFLPTSSTSRLESLV